MFDSNSLDQSIKPFDLFFIQYNPNHPAVLSPPAGQTKEQTVTSVCCGHVGDITRLYNVQFIRNLDEKKRLTACRSLLFSDIILFKHQEFLKSLDSSEQRQH